MVSNVKQNWKSEIFKILVYKRDTALTLWRWNSRLFVCSLRILYTSSESFWFLGCNL